MATQQNEGLAALLSEHAEGLRQGSTWAWAVLVENPVPDACEQAEGPEKDSVRRGQPAWDMERCWQPHLSAETS